MYTFLSTQAATKQLYDDAVEEHRYIQHTYTHTHIVENKCMTGSFIQIHSDLITSIQKAFIHTKRWQTHTDIQERKQQGHVLQSHLFNYTELREAEK